MRLGILSPSTCVGLRYGQPELSLEVFLGSMESSTLWPKALTSRLSVMRQRICLPPPPTRLNLHFQSQAGLSFCVTPS